MTTRARTFYLLKNQIKSENGKLGIRLLLHLSKSDSTLHSSNSHTLCKPSNIKYGLDWIGLTVGYWCFHRSRECSQAQTLPYKASASWSSWLFLRTCPLKGYSCRESINSNLKESVTRATLKMLVLVQQWMCKAETPLVTKVIIEDQEDIPDVEVVLKVTT